MRALASKTASRPSIATSRSIVTTIISTSVKPDCEAPDARARTFFFMASVHVRGRIGVLDEARNPRRALTEPEEGRKSRHPIANRRDRDVDSLEVVGNARAHIDQLVGPARGERRVAAEVMDLVRPHERIDGARRGRKPGRRV